MLKCFVRRIYHVLYNYFSSFMFRSIPKIRRHQFRGAVRGAEPPNDVVNVGHGRAQGNHLQGGRGRNYGFFPHSAAAGVVHVVELVEDLGEDEKKKEKEMRGGCREGE